MNETLAIGVDLGATKIASTLATRSGKVLAARTTPTLVTQGPAAVFDRIAAEINALLADAPGPVLGAGIGSPGIIDNQRGIVLGAVNLGWKNIHLTEEVAARLKNVSVFVDNDANANAVGEGYFGSAVGSRDYILLTVGSGLGSGVVSDGRVITGAHSMGSDLGHYSLDPDNGPICRCGHRGCAETICSGPGLVTAARLVLAKRQSPTTLVDSPELSSTQVLAAARAGDAAALAAFAFLGRWMGHIAAVAAAVMDPDVIVIGGGLGTACVDLIQSEMTRDYLRRVPKCMAAPPIRPATLPSSALGVASLVWSRLQPGT